MTVEQTIGLPNDTEGRVLLPIAVIRSAVSLTCAARTVGVGHDRLGVLERIADLAIGPRRGRGPDR